MFEPYLYKLNAAIDNGLNAIKDLKNLASRFQQYEYIANLGDIQKQFESIRGKVGICKYPDPTPHKGLTPKGKLFFYKIFIYNNVHSWKNIPENFRELLTERKIQLNQTIEFNEDSITRLMYLNRILFDREERVREFYYTRLSLARANGFKIFSDDDTPGTLTIKCYAKSGKYDFTYGSSDPKTSFYQIEFPINDVINSIPIFYFEKQPKPDFLHSLTDKFNGEKICLLFSLLASDGLLAWEDLLNIGSIEIDLDIKYKFL